MTAYTFWEPKVLLISLYITVSKKNTFFVLYTEIQDGLQKWRESDFWQKVADYSVYALRVKNLVQISLSQTVSVI